MDFRHYNAEMGIAMQVSGDARYAIEIQRSPNGSTGWVSVIVLPPGPASYIDYLPLDGVDRYYQARSVELVNGAPTRWGPWLATSPTHGKPIQLSLESASRLLSPPARPVATAPIPKTLRIPFGEFVPIDDSIDFTYTTVSVGNRLAGGGSYFFAPLVLPVGATVVAFRSRLYRQNGGDVLDTRLIRVVTETPTTLVTLTPSGNGWTTNSSGTVSELVAAGQSFVVVAALTSASAAGAKLAWVEIDYTVTNYETSI